MTLKVREKTFPPQQNIIILNTGIVFEAYSPLGNPGRPFRTDAEPVVMEDKVIKEIAEKHSVSPAQVCTLL